MGRHAVGVGSLHSLTLGSSSYASMKDEDITLGEVLPQPGKEVPML